MEELFFTTFGLLAKMFDSRVSGMKAGKTVQIHPWLGEPGQISLAWSEYAPQSTGRRHLSARTEDINLLPPMKGTQEQFC